MGIYPTNFRRSKRKGKVWCSEIIWFDESACGNLWDYLARATKLDTRLIGLIHMVEFVYLLRSRKLIHWILDFYDGS